MKVTLRVTAKHIEEGVQASCQECPVALALCELVDKRFDVHVAANRLRVMADKTYWSVDPPLAIKAFIRKYDYPLNNSMYPAAEPFECELEIPQELLR